MELNDYQLQASFTDQRNSTKNKEELLLPVLGLVGEVGSVAAEYKKRMRDKESYETYREKLSEELGDSLWYLAIIAKDMKLDLNSIALQNITKNNARWGHDTPDDFYDKDYHTREQLPRFIIIDFKENEDGKICMFCDDKIIGDPLSDNSYKDDGYRFHDAIHLAFASVLRWSPVFRSLLKRKRKSNAKVDEVEDGARAAVIEEAIAALSYNYASTHNFLREITSIDYELLSLIMRMVQNLEIKDASYKLWQTAIIEGYKVFRKLRENNGGKVKCDLRQRKIEFID